eukprot:766089-Hanusia_phi.AAC.4
MLSRRMSREVVDLLESRSFSLAATCKLPGSEWCRGVPVDCLLVFDAMLWSEFGGNPRLGA